MSSLEGSGDGLSLIEVLGQVVGPGTGPAQRARKVATVWINTAHVTIAGGRLRMTARSCRLSGDLPLPLS